jgi:ligand-binding sensor domain-containing protein
VWLRVILLWTACLGVGQAATDVLIEPEYLVRSWQMEDGLPDSSIKAIVQTRDGYLWLGTLRWRAVQDV